MNSLGTARGSIELDFGGMRNSVKSAIAELNKIEATAKKNDAELKLLQSTSEKTGSALEKAGQKVKLLANKLDAAKQKASVYEREMQTLTSKLEDNKKAQEEVSGKLADTKNKYAEAEQNVRKMSTALADSKSALAAAREQYGKNSEEVKVAKQAVAEHTEALKAAKETQKDYAQQISALQGDQNRLQREFADGTDALEKWDTALISAQADVTNLQAELNNADGEVQSIAQAMAEEEEAARLAAEEMERMANTTKSAGEILSDAGDKITRVGNGMQKVGTALTVAVTAPLTAAAKKTSDLAGEYEDSAAKLNTIADTTAVSADQLQKQSREVSDDMTTDWNDVNEAMYQYISATQDTVGASKAAEVAIMGQVGGFADSAEQVVDGLTSIGNAYNMYGADAMEEISDKMLQTQNLGKTTLGEISKYIGQVAPLASQAGISIDELFGSIATLTASGIQTRSVMTGLKATLSNIIKPTEEAAAASEALGIQFDAAALSEKGLGGIMKEIKEKIESASPEYAKLADEAGDYNKQIAELTATQEKNKNEISDLETQNKALKKQMEATKEQYGTSSTQYKEYSKQLSENKDKISELKAANKDLATNQKDLEKQSSGVTAQMEVLANAVDSPLSAYASLFGSVEALNDMMVLASDEGSKKLAEYTKGVSDAQGTTAKAFKKMTDTDIAKFRKSLNRLKNTGIDVGEKILPVFADLMEKLADGVTKFSELDDSTQETILKFAAFAAAAGPALKVTGKFTSGLGGIVSKAGSVVSALSGVTTATGEVAGVAEGAVTTLGTGSTGLTGVLGTLASPVGVAVGAATAVAAIGIAVEVAHKKAVKNNLAEHFGTVKLTADEARDAAEELCSTNWSANLSLYTNAKEELDSVSDQLSETVANINKTQWKIKCGITLSDEDKEQYKTDLDNYIKQEQDWLDNNKLACTMAINTLYGDDSEAGKNITAFTDSVFTGVETEMKSLGDKLSDVVNKAFEDGTLDEEATQETIKDLQTKMAKLQAKVTKAQSEVKYADLANDFSMSTLPTEESYKKLTSAMNDKIKEMSEQLNEAKLQLNVPVQIQFDEDGDEEAYKDALMQNELQYQKDVSDSINKALEWEMSTLQEAYPDLSAKNGKKFISELEKGFTDSIATLEPGTFNMQSVLNNLDITAGEVYDELTNTDKAAIKQLLKNIEPQKEQLEKISNTYREAGKTVPESISEGLHQIDLLEAMTGDIDSYYTLIADQAANSPELQTAISNIYASVGYVPETLANVLQEKYPEVYEATIGIFDTMTSGEQQNSEDVKANFTALGLSVSDSLINVLAQKETEVQQAVFSTLSTIERGLGSNRDTLVNLFANLGWDLPQSFIDNLALQDGEMQKTVINNLMYASTVPEKERQAILDRIGVNAEDIKTTFCDTVKSGTRDAEDAGKQLGEATAKGAESTARNSGKNWLSAFWDTIKNVGGSIFNRKGIGSTILPAITPFADGGVVTEPTFAVMGENSDPEAIIPLSVAKRDRARALYDYVGSEIGADYSVQNSNNSLDTATLAKAIAAELATTLKNAPINNNVTVQMDGGDVLLDRERVGRAVAPTVSRVLATR